MGRILHSVWLGGVVLLFVAEPSSSRSLRTSNGSNLDHPNVPVRSKPQNCSHRGENICQKYGKKCVSYDGGEVCLEEALEQPATCTVEAQRTCSEQGAVCDDTEGKVTCKDRPMPQNCSTKGQSVCNKYGRTCVSYYGGEVCLDNPLETQATCTVEIQRACSEQGKVCDDREGQVKCKDRSKPQNCSHRGESVCLKYGKKCISYDGGETCVAPTVPTKKPCEKGEKVKCVD